MLPAQGGTRRERLEWARRTRWHWQLRALGLVSVLAVAGGVAAADESTRWVVREAQPAAGAPEGEPAVNVAPAIATSTDEQVTLLLARVPEPEGPAEAVTLLAAGPAGAPGAILFLPAGMLVDIPGVGLQPLGLAQQFGGTALLESTVENALGVELDAAAAVSDSGLTALLERTGGLTVDIGEALGGTDEAAGFEPGAQDLDGARLADYWTYLGEDETELDGFPRQQQVLTALLAAVGEDPGVLDRLLEGGAPQLETNADPKVARAVLAGLARASAEDRLRVAVAPVSPLGGEGPDGRATYRAQEEELDDLIGELLAGSRPEEGGGTPTRVQVLNGIGTPGIGAEVAEALGGGSLQITSSDNAANFGYPETLVLVYDDSEASLEAAREVRERLGVGTIRLSRRPQSVVDLTVVVGADFPDRSPPRVYGPPARGSFPDQEPDT